MPKRKARTVPLSEKQKRVREATRINWLLKGQLKSAQLQYLRIGALLIEMRQKTLYDALGHASLEEYAEKRLRLRRSSLYRYIQVYEWVAEFHNEWLLPKPKGFIPELNDVADVMWIERKLKERDLTTQTRKELETMRTEALEGRLRDSELEVWRKRGGREENALKSFLQKLRLLRRRGAELKDIPKDAIIRLDESIEIIRKAMANG